MQEASEKPPCSGEGSKGLRNVDMQCPMFRKDVPEEVLGVRRGEANLLYSLVRTSNHFHRLLVLRRVDLSRTCSQDSHPFAGISHLVFVLRRADPSGYLPAQMQLSPATGQFLRRSFTTPFRQQQLRYGTSAQHRLAEQRPHGCSRVLKRYQIARAT